MDKPLTESDSELLEIFARSNDEEAFQTLVFRHLGLVLGSARRSLPGRPQAAEEVAQNVFITLARKAGKLRSHPCLPAWLQKTVAYEAMRAARKKKNDVKKMTRLQNELVIDRDAATCSDPSMDAALPLLDEALASLGATDRRVLMLRYYEGKR